MMFLLFTNDIIERISNVLLLYLVTSTVVDEVVPGSAATWRKKLYLIFSLIFYYSIWVSTLKKLQAIGKRRY